MENLYFLSNGTISSNGTWPQMDPPRLFICHGAPPYRGFDLSSMLLFFTGMLLFLLSLAVVVKRWRHYVAVRRHRLMTIQAAASRGAYPGTLRTIIVRSDARDKCATQMVGLTLNHEQSNFNTPAVGLEFMPATKLPPYAEYPPPSYEDSERRPPKMEHV